MCNARIAIRSSVANSFSKTEDAFSWSIMGLVDVEPPREDNDAAVGAVGSAMGGEVRLGRGRFGQEDHAAMGQSFRRWLRESLVRRRWHRHPAKSIPLSVTISQEYPPHGHQSTSICGPTSCPA